MSWITVKPHGAKSKGQPVKLDNEGRIVGGMGGKFNGKHISQVRSKDEPKPLSQLQDKTLRSRYEKLRESEHIKHIKTLVGGGTVNAYEKTAESVKLNALHEEIKNRQKSKPEQARQSILERRAKRKEEIAAKSLELSEQTNEQKRWTLWEENEKIKNNIKHQKDKIKSLSAKGSTLATFYRTKERAIFNPVSGTASNPLTDHPDNLQSIAKRVKVKSKYDEEVKQNERDLQQAKRDLQTVELKLQGNTVKINALKPVEKQKSISYEEAVKAREVRNQSSFSSVIKNQLSGVKNTVSPQPNINKELNEAQKGLSILSKSKIWEIAQKAGKTHVAQNNAMRKLTAMMQSKIDDKIETLRTDIRKLKLSGSRESDLIKHRAQITNWQIQRMELDK